MPLNYITSNPAIPGVQTAQNTDVQTALLRQQQVQATKQDETQRKLASFRADPASASPTQRALSYAAQTPGAGGEAMQLATSAGKEQADHEDKAMELVLKGDIEGAQSYAQMHGVNSVTTLLAHPTIVQEVVSFAGLADKVRPKDNAYRAKFVQSGMEALPKILGSINPQTNQPYTYQEALPVVKAMAMKAAESVPFPSMTKLVQDEQGNFVYASPTGAPQPAGIKGAKPVPRGGRGGITPAGNSIQRSFPGNDGNMYATLRQLGPDGKPRTVQLTDEQGQPIRSGEINKFAGQVYLKTADQPGGGSLPDAQAVAGQLYKSASPAVVPRSDSPSPADPRVAPIRRYIPGKGFVSVP